MNSRGYFKYSLFLLLIVYNRADRSVFKASSVFVSNTLEITILPSALKLIMRVSNNDSTVYKEFDVLEEKKRNTI